MEKEIYPACEFKLVLVPNFPLVVFYAILSLSQSPQPHSIYVYGVLQKCRAGLAFVGFSFICSWPMDDRFLLSRPSDIFRSIQQDHCLSRSRPMPRIAVLLWPRSYVLENLDSTTGGTDHPKVVAEH